MEDEKKEQEQSFEIKEITTTTNHEHYYNVGQIGELKEVICSCGHGMQIPLDVEVKDGRILWK